MEGTDRQVALTVADASVVVSDEIGLHPQLHLVQDPEVSHFVAGHVGRQPLQHRHRRRHLGQLTNKTSNVMLQNKF